MRAAVLRDVRQIVLEERPVPVPGPHEVLVRIRSVGVCGSDTHYYEHGRIGDFVVTAPLVLGHEASGEVVAVGADATRGLLGKRVSLEPGVPDLTCEQCRAGRYNLCPNVRFFATPPVDGAFCEYVTILEGFAYPVPDSIDDDAAALLEPLSVGIWACRKGEVSAGSRVLVTGAGPIGLLAALMGVQRGLEVHVYDHNKVGPKPELTRDLGCTYHSDAASLTHTSPDILMECTGVPAVIRDCLGATGPAGIVCLTGVTEPKKMFDLDVGAINRTMVLDNDCVFGTVNANRRHYEMAAQALARADKSWLARLITRRVPLDRWSEALEHRKGDIKVIVDFTQ